MHYAASVTCQNSYARLSTSAQANTCIVFVHGFFGNVTKTWQYFSDLCDSPNLPGSAVLEKSDLYFFDYPAQKAFVKNSASDLGTFLLSLFPRPLMELFHFVESDRAAIRDPWLPY
jgi:esterase/lipase superfamily enzyme